MRACTRGQHDEAVNIGELERHIAARAPWPEPTRPFRPERLAVLGSGPAGLSAAYQLARLGYPMIVFEAGDELGGLLRTGIPAYRLPRKVIDREIAFILAHGVQVRSGQRVSRSRLVEMRREYDGVVVATGLQKRRTADLGADDPRVLRALDFLDLLGDGGHLGARSPVDHERVLGAEMPAIAEEVEEALAEGVRIEQLAAPLRLEGAGDGTALVCRRMTLGEPDDSGRPRPVPVDGDDGLAAFRCDTVLLALGQAAGGGRHGASTPLWAAWRRPRARRRWSMPPPSRSAMSLAWPWPRAGSGRPARAERASSRCAWASATGRAGRPRMRKRSAASAAAPVRGAAIASSTAPKAS